MRLRSKEWLNNLLDNWTVVSKAHVGYRYSQTQMQKSLSVHFSVDVALYCVCDVCLTIVIFPSMEAIF